MTRCGIIMSIFLLTVHSGGCVGLVAGPVRDIQVVSKGAYHLFIGWERPLESDGEVKGYEVSYSKVYHLPDIFIQPPQKDIYFMPSESFQLPCEAKGVPKPRYVWKVNGKVLKPSYRVMQLPKSGTIVFNNLDVREEGVYQCFADNEVGVSASIKVNVRMAKLGQFFVEPKRTHVAQEGSYLTLPCVPPVSTPASEIIWILRDDDDLWQPVELDGRVIMDIEGRLHFTHVVRSDEKDGASYSCAAENHFLRAVSTGPEHVIQVQTSSGEKHEVELMWSTPSSMVFMKGETLRLQCIFSGNTLIQWEKTGARIPDHAKYNSGDPTLEITDVQESDAGSYSCTGYNTASVSPIQRTFDVIIASAPYWKVEPQDVEVNEGEPGTVTCEAYGIPPPKISWYINGEPVMNGQDYKEDFRMTANNLTITDFTGNVQCNASNKYGYVFADVTILVLEKSYRSSTVLRTNQSQIFIDNLDEGQEYNIHIRAWANQTAVDSSLNVVTALSGSGIPSLPQYTSVTPLSSTSLLITWLPPAQSEGRLIGYTLRYSSPREPEETQDVTSPSATSFALTGLKEFSLYRVRISARNTNGDGNFTEGVIVNTFSDIPSGPPLNVTLQAVNPTNIVMRWHPPVFEDQNGIIIGYRIRYRETDVQFGDVFVHEGVIFERVFAGLRNDTSYQFKIAAQTINGTGPSTDWMFVSTATTTSTVPGPVRMARVVLRGVHHFLIEWEPPEEPNGILTGYEIGYKKVDGFDVGEIVQTTLLNDSYRSRAYIENLDENQEYTIYVWAHTKVGRGKDYYFDAKTANAGPPLRPEIKIELIGEDFIYVSWSVGARQDAPAGSFYYVKYREYGNMEFEKTDVERINMWMNVSGLIPNKRYEVLVVAGNKYDDSPSDLVQIKTKGERKPTPPSDVQVVTCGQHHAVISWTRSLTNVSTYYIEYNTSFTPDNWTEAVVINNSSVTEATIALSPYANYTFRVIAESEIGRSEPSLPSSYMCRTEMDRPYKSPSNVYFDTSVTGRITVKWDPMPEIEHNGEGFSYVIFLKHPLGGADSTIRDWRVNKWLYYTMDVYQPYQVKVAARNVVGQSAYAILTAYSGEAKPMVVPSNFELVSVNANAAVFQWDAVDTSVESMQGKFRGYKVRVWEAGQRNSTERITVVVRTPFSFSDGPANLKEKATIYDLPSGSDLEAEVQVSNTHFDSDPSHLLTFSTVDKSKVKGDKTTVKGGQGVLECDFQVKPDSYDSYIVTWKKIGLNDPVLIQYGTFPPHIHEQYKDRVTLVNGTSLGIDNMQDSDEGWYSCDVVSQDGENSDGTQIYLSVTRPIEENGTFIIRETPSLYKSLTLPYINYKAQNLKWVYRILEKNNGPDEIIFEDPDPETGFVLLPVRAGKVNDTKDIYLVAIVHQNGIRSLRDLNSSSLPLLKNIMTKGQEITLKTFGIKANQLNMFVKYQPTFYHLHVYFKHVANSHPDFAADRAHLLADIIDNIVLRSRHYRKKTLTFAIDSDHDLYSKYKESGYFSN